MVHEVHEVSDSCLFGVVVEEEKSSLIFSRPASDFNHNLCLLVKLLLSSRRASHQPRQQWTTTANKTHVNTIKRDGLAHWHQECVVQQQQQHSSFQQLRHWQHTKAACCVCPVRVRSYSRRLRSLVVVGRIKSSSCPWNEKQH